MEKLTNEKIAEIARSYGISPAALLAVKLVESGNRSGFLSSGKPQILFEGHTFYRHLKAYTKLNLVELQKEHPNVIYSVWDKSKYYGGEKEWLRLEEARKINEKYANYSTSWGMFQIMGFNWKLCKSESLESFVDDMCKSQEKQLLLSINYMISTGLIPFLEKRDWAGFAKKYNGPSYKKNEYDTRLQSAYNMYLKQFPK